MMGVPDVVREDANLGLNARYVSPGLAQGCKCLATAQIQAFAKLEGKGKDSLASRFGATGYRENGGSNMDGNALTALTMLGVMGPRGPQ